MTRRSPVPAAGGRRRAPCAGGSRRCRCIHSPCSFPLLTTLLARHTGADQPAATRVRRALLFATSLSIGAVVFVLAVGVLFALGGRGLAGAVTFTSVPGRVIRVIVGIGLIALGLIQADRIHANLRGLEPAIHGLLRRQAGLRRRRPLVGTAVFGFGYPAAGFTRLRQARRDWHLTRQRATRAREAERRITKLSHAEPPEHIRADDHTDSNADPERFVLAVRWRLDGIGWRTVGDALLARTARQQALNARDEARAQRAAERALDAWID